jgi:heme-degrading monooxygenase HmoA
MAVLMIAEVPNLTEEIYGGMVGQMTPLMRASKGFISHAGGPNPSGGWRVVEIWESEEDGQNWFNDNVKPNLPPDIVPNRTYHPLHTAFTK